MQGGIAGGDGMNEIKHIDVDTIPAGTRLDALVLEHIIGDKNTEEWYEPGFSVMSHRTAYKVEAEIEKRELTVQYVKELWKEVDPEFTSMFNAVWFVLIHASPEQRNRAALKTVMATTEPLDTD